VPETPDRDIRMDMALGNLLRTGVIVAGAVVLTGGILYLIRHGPGTPSYHVFRGEASYLHRPEAILRHAVSGEPKAIIQFGLLLLIATPVARVAFSASAFLRAADYKYTVITLIVLGLLIYGLFGNPFR
jgi:uncharacterized membrane protein